MSKTIFKDITNNEEVICELNELIQPNKIIYLQKKIDEFNQQKYDMYNFVDSVDILVEKESINGNMSYERHIYLKKIEKNTEKIF